MCMICVYTCKHYKYVPAHAAAGPPAECQQCESTVISQRQPSRLHHVAANGNNLSATYDSATATAEYCAQMPCRICNAQYSAATAVVCAYAHPVDAAHCLVQRS